MSTQFANITPFAAAKVTNAILRSNEIEDVTVAPTRRSTSTATSSRPGSTRTWRRSRTVRPARRSTTTSSPNSTCNNPLGSSALLSPQVGGSTST
jgi:hypothetical protein